MFALPSMGYRGFSAHCSSIMNAATQLHAQDQFAALRLLLQSLQSDIEAALLAAREARQDAAVQSHGVADLKDGAEKAQREAAYDAEIRRVVRELQSVEDALGRLRDGTYGVCMDCGTRIAGARLAVQPAARLCVPCQAAQERSVEHARAAPAA